MLIEAKNYGMWRISRHGAGVKRRRLKLRLGGRKVCVVRFTLVVLQGERVK